MESKKYKSVQDYISAAPSVAKRPLKELRKIIKETLPEAEELISYNMPAFKLHGVIAYFAAHTNHIGFYPGSKAVIEAFKDKLSSYETSKGTIRFPYSHVIPAPLVKKIVKYKAMANLEKKRSKSKKR